MSGLLDYFMGPRRSILDGEPEYNPPPPAELRNAPDNAFLPRNRQEAFRGILADIENPSLGATLATGVGDGGVAGIITPATARGLNMATRIPSDPWFRQSVEATPGAQILDDGVLVPVMRSQKPDQSGAEAIRGGVFYMPVAPQTTKYARAYDTTRTPPRGSSEAPYGGSETVTGDTLLRAPMAVRGLTGGAVPERAYRELKSGAALEQLQREVQSFNHYGIARRDPGIMNEWRDQVAGFLAKHGGEPGMASEILRHSQVGNRLKYALQEHAIGATARDAGYDSIVGMGTRKPYLSEVFDLRQGAYPVPGMPEYQVLTPRFADLEGAG